MHSIREEHTMHSIREEHTMSQSIKYLRPRTRTEAIDMLARPGYQAAPFIVHPKPTALRQMGVEALVDLSLLGLNTIQETQDGTIHIGALATLQEMMENPILSIGTRGLLSQAAGLAAGPGIRNLSGLWGAIQARSGPPEVLLALLVLEAQVVLLEAGEKQCTLSFPEFCSMGPNSLHKGALVLEAALPPFATSCGWALERVARTPRDEAIVAAAAVVEVEGGKTKWVSLALAGANPLPRRIPTVETDLLEKAFDVQTLQAAAETVQEQSDPASDFRGSSEYRRSMAGLVARRALEKAWEHASGRKI